MFDIYLLILNKSYGKMKFYLKNIHAYQISNQPLLTDYIYEFKEFKGVISLQFVTYFMMHKRNLKKPLKI